MDIEFRDVARILIIDDEPANVLLLERLLKREGYRHVRGASDARMALPLYHDFHPDLILLDLMMPHVDGYDVMKQLASSKSDQDYLPILVLTADASLRAKQKALSTGAKDFLTKPIEATETLLRIRNLLETRFLYRQIQNHNQV